MKVKISRPCRHVYVVFAQDYPNVEFSETFSEGVPSVGLKKSKIGFTKLRRCQEMKHKNWLQHLRFAFL